MKNLHFFVEFCSISLKLYQTVVFNGISISLADLKREIMEKEGLKSTEVDLSISNAQNSEIYKNEQEMISKNSSVIIQRTPLSHSFTRFLTWLEK